MGAGSEALTESPVQAGPVLYCDTSALARAYLEDERGHEEMRQRLLDGDERVITSAVAELEMVSAMHSAVRAGQVRDPDAILFRITSDMGPDGRVVLLGLDGSRVLPRARDICERHRLRALDALHLAVALVDGLLTAGEPGLVFVTRDADQAAAAAAEGLRVE